MSDYFEFPPSSYDPQSPNNPFYGLGGYDEVTADKDPYAEVERQVLETLNIEDFSFVTFDNTKVDPNELRGNRFSSILEAVLYLVDARILNFSKILVNEEGEIIPAIDTTTDKLPKRN